METSPQSKIAAIILAGGQSSRMGQDKALIEFQGIPLVQKVCRVAQSCTSQVYVITPWTERYQYLVPEGCRLIREVAFPKGRSHLSGPVSTDRRDKKKAENRRKIPPPGPLVGFSQALTHVPVTTEWVLLLACDLPNLTTAVIGQWSGYLAATPEESIALLPRHAKGWEPLCGFYRRRCLALLEEFIEGGGRSFQQWLAPHPVQELPLINRQVLFNCNSPEDLAQLQFFR